MSTHTPNKNLTPPSPQQKNCITTLTELDIIEVTGTDAATFLQSQFTLDVFSLTENQNGYGAYCDARGKVQFTLNLLKQNEHFSILCKKINSKKLLKTLKKYALFSQVKFNLNDQNSFLGIIGKTLLDNEIKPKAHWQLSHTTSLLQTTEKEISELLHYYNKNNYTTIDTNTFTHAKIEQHIFDITPQTSNQFTPHMIGMNSHNGLCFTKGCYLGQEVIARTEHLGKVKRKLTCIIWPKTQDIEIGNPLINSNKRQIGTLLDFCQLDNQTFIGLACLKNEAINQAMYINNQAITIA